MKRFSTLKSTLQSVAIMVLSCFAINASAQSTPFELTTLGTPLVIDFNDFRGKGFTPAPVAGSGQLNSNNWSIYGFSDGSLQFGGTQTTGDYARDTTSGGLQFSGGIYALNKGAGDHAFWIQPTGSDANPGVFTTRIQNNTGASLDSVKISYDIIVFNDQARGQVVRFEVGALDTNNFQPLPQLTYVTPETADNQFHVVTRTITMPGGGIPNGAYLYGRWIVKDSLGGGSRDELGFDNITVTAYGTAPAAQPCSDLFFSEYIEGSSSNKAIEIFNPTANPINLSNYRVELYSNGATAATQVQLLTGTLAAGDVYVIANASANATILAKSDITSNVTFFNGDDALALIKGVSDTLDIIGTVGFDPGTNWPIGNPPTGATSENTLVRKPTVQQGEKNWLIAMNQWDVYPQDFADSLGTHTMNACGVIVAPTFNFTTATASVNENAGTVDVTVSISSAADCSVQVALDPASTATPGADFTFTSPQTLTFTAAGPTTQTITIPIINDAVSDPNETIILNLQTPGGTGGCALGTITTTTITIVEVNPTFTFSAATMSVNEGAGNATVTVNLNIPADCTIQIALNPASTATAGADFTFTSPQTLTFTAAGSATQTITIPIIDDAILYEGNETIILDLQNVGGTGGCAIGTVSTMTITIVDNDYPYYTIAQIHGEDALGVADSNGKKVELRGIVTFPDIRGSGVQFYIQDATAGINVFHFTNDYGYTVTLGDSIIVRGTLDQFSGLLEIIPDTIILVSTGNMMPAPIVVDSFYEALESMLLEIKGYTVVNPAQWTNSGSGFNVDVTNGTDTLEIRIDNDVDVYGTPAPTGPFNLVGVLSQFDGSSPFLDGYNLLVRSLADITAVVMPVAAFNLTDDELEVTVINTSSNDPTSLSWNFDDGTIITDQDTVVHLYTAAGTYDICLTATNAAGSNTTCQTVTVQGVGIDEALIGNVKVYPIPVTNAMTIEMEISINKIEVMDVTGKVVRSINASAKKTSVKMSDLANGIYLVKIHTEKGIISKKVMKQ